MQSCAKNNVAYFDNVLTWSYPGIGYLCFYMFAEFIVYFILVLLVEVKNKFCEGYIVKTKKNLQFLLNILFLIHTNVQVLDC